jgi:hypothetical protein
MGEALLAVLPGKGPDWEPGDPLLRLPIFSWIHLNLVRQNMDTVFVDEALQAYRDRTGDMRSWDSLPVAVASQILIDAQRLKGYRRGRFSQPAATEGIVDS